MGEVMGTPAAGAGPDSPFDQPFFLIINLVSDGWGHAVLAVLAVPLRPLLRLLHVL